MSTVTVNLGQTALNTAVAVQSGAATLADRVNIFFLTSGTFSKTHPAYSDAVLTESFAQLWFNDGSTEQYKGIVVLTPNASSGHAIATSIEISTPSAFYLTFGGNFTFDYSGAGSASGALIVGTGGTITAADLQTVVPPGKTPYDSLLGNVHLALRGALATDTAGNFKGTVNSFSTAAEYYVSPSSISGNFNVSGNGTAIGMGQNSASVSGTLTGFSNTYWGGSQVSISDLSLPVTGTTVVDERLLFDAANFSGNDVMSVTLPSVVTAPWNIAAGSGNDAVTLRGGGGALSVDGGSGNDTITLLDNGHAVDGGDGADTVSLAGTRSSFSIVKNGDTFVLATAGQASDVLKQVETLKFSDATLSLEYNDVVQALYLAYFGRAADFGGLANFQAQLANLNAPHDVAAVSAAYYTNAGIRALIDSFGSSDESKALYSGDTTSFVTAIYKNILSRAPDADGLRFWVDAIDHQGLTKANASLSIMAGALSNTTVQGKLDAALVNNRTTIAADFSFAIDTPAEISAYAGDTAAATVRAMLGTVTASTDLAAFQATVQLTLAKMQPAVGLVGIAEHDPGFVV